MELCVFYDCNIVVNDLFGNERQLGLVQWSLRKKMYRLSILALCSENNFIYHIEREIFSLKILKISPNQYYKINIHI